MVLAIGLVVDDAIVVVENVFRHIEGGQNANPGGIDRSARDRGPRYRNDDHARSGLCADRISWRGNGDTLQGVCLYSGSRRACVSNTL